MSSSTVAAMERKHQNDAAAEPSPSSATAPAEETSSSSETATEQRVIKRRSSSFRSKRCAPSSSSGTTPSQQSRASLVLTALELNNVAVSLLERHGYVQAIEALGDSLDVLARSSQQSSEQREQEEYAAPSTLLPPAELLLARAEVRLLELSAGSSLSSRGDLSGKKDESEEDDDDCRCETPFACADPIRMRAPSIAKKCRCVNCRGTRGVNCTSPSSPSSSSSSTPPTQPIPSRRGLLAVIAYNLGLAHQLLGFKLGRMGHVNTATQLYEKSEAIVLSIADALERRKRSNERRRKDGRGSVERNRDEKNDSSESVLPPGVDITYLARAIVNNMGLILFEYGDRDSAREYFDGLESIRIETPPSHEADASEDEDDGNDREEGCCRRRREEEEEEEEERDDDGKPWEAFAVNAIIARGVLSSPAA